MPLLTIREAYIDSPVFQSQVEAAQNRVLETWESLDSWVEKYRSVLAALRVMGSSKRILIEEKLVQKNDKKCRPDLQYAISLLETMEREIIEPVANVQNRLREDLSVQQKKFKDEQKAFDKQILEYSGLIKCTMDPELAVKLVEESYQLYSLKVAKCQKYINWVDYLNQIQSGSELWWLNKNCQVFDRAMRWHSDCMACLRSTESTVEVMTVQLNRYPESAALEIPQNNTQMAEEIFRTDFAKYRKALGLPSLDLLDASMLKCAIDLVPDRYERVGYLLFNMNHDEVWQRGFFEITRLGQFVLVPSELCDIEMEPIELVAATLNEISHPSRHNVFQLSHIGINSVRTIYLQAECTLDKNAWSLAFHTYIKDDINGDSLDPVSEPSVMSQASSAVSTVPSRGDEPESHRFSGSQIATSRTTSYIQDQMADVYESRHLSPPPLLGNFVNENVDTDACARRMLEDESRSHRTSNGDEMIIKVGQVLVRDFKSAKSRESFNHNRPSSIGSWRKVMFTLKSSGILSQYHEQDKSIVGMLNLKDVTRFNIRPLDDSYFHNNSSFVIEETGKDPHYFSVGTLVERNVWLCLLKAFAQPEILGRVVPIPKLYRVCRSFWLRVIEGRNFSSSTDLYCQVAFDGTLASFTSTKFKTTAPFWREDFLFDDLAPFREGVAINVMGQNRYQKDTRVGRAFIPVRSIRPGEFYEGWYPVIQGDPKPSGGLFQNMDSKKKKSIATFGTSSMAPADGAVADLRLKLRYDEIVVLKSSEYATLLELLMEIESDVVYDLVIGPKHLDWVAETLLKVYCARHHSIPWLNYLAEKEVQATEDPNILFRGNSILTKAIDAYMKMVGLQYVDSTIGNIVREVCKRKVSCEVDGSKLNKPEDVKGQWKTLFSYADQLFQAIQNSKNQCPRELRCFFNHLRRVISEKFDKTPEQLLMTKYTCVSGFLFLRLFCPAVLSPKLFGLVREHPDPKTHRTLTLLAKSLQCLANLADFGVKEPYMAQMNNFISDNTNNLMEFIDFIASPPSADIMWVQTRYPLPPHPTGFHAQLPPYVIDLDRELSFLSGYVTRYTKNLKQTASSDTRFSKAGKLERLISVCNTIDFMVKDCVQSGTKDVTAQLLS
ncbi:hypothetical protein DSO57_1018689 [Entomophthora muscae]|uniref:Uncharacterized protein n=1 Tax=Entomophthora muscae TaxID=34485 RepID=A0ACC2TFP3_9FUNG|nr:hypothetical protein DSO57_1018689 [Entomophthora muscae]